MLLRTWMLVLVEDVHLVGAELALRPGRGRHAHGEVPSGPDRAVGAVRRREHESRADHRPPAEGFAAVGKEDLYQRLIGEGGGRGRRPAQDAVRARLGP